MNYGKGYVPSTYSRTIRFLTGLMPAKGEDALPFATKSIIPQVALLQKRALFGASANPRPIRGFHVSPRQRLGLVLCQLAAPLNRIVCLAGRLGQLTTCPDTVGEVACHSTPQHT